MKRTIMMVTSPREMCSVRAKPRSSWRELTEFRFHILSSDRFRKRLWVVHGGGVKEMIQGIGFFAVRGVCGESFAVEDIATSMNLHTASKHAKKTPEMKHVRI